MSDTGLAPRRVAADILDNVLRRRRSLDEQLDGAATDAPLRSLSERDRALARALVAIVLRRLGTLRHLLGLFLDRGCPPGAPRIETALLIGAAQVLWLEVPDHAAVDLAVQLARADRKAAHYAGLVNAVLRRVAREGKARLAAIGDATLDTPAWLMNRWVRHYGAEKARAIAAAHGQEPALDFTVKSNPEHWAKLFGGRVLATGSVRGIVHGPVTQLPGYADGAWWVQDAAAALPVRLFGDVRGQTIVDLCAAPGGKTAQLAAAGAHVTAIDRSEARLDRLRQNLLRLNLVAETVVADAAQWSAGPYDAVLLDAPCSSTGAIRRHPDIPWIKRETDIAALAAMQLPLIAHAVDLVKPGGLLLYCTCSLEPEEGEQVVEALLAAHSRLRRRPISPEEVAHIGSVISPSGDLRTLPCDLPDPDPRWGGLDGFYAARLERT
jgi:16S rRNA (cytosine967-C5)-methyltransferase